MKEDIFLVQRTHTLQASTDYNLTSMEPQSRFVVDYFVRRIDYQIAHSINTALNTRPPPFPVQQTPE